MTTIERRTDALEMRASKGDNGELYITGYAATFNTESKDLGGFREVVAPGAFTRSLKEKRDVKALFNHDANHVLGRVKNGTLTLAQDERGLQWRCELNPAMQAHRDLHASVDRKDIDECSFAFTVGKAGQVWSERSLEGGGAMIVRTLTDVDLFDVSAVCYPAYPGTDVASRNTVVAPEVRSMIQELAAKRGLAPEGDDMDASWEEEIAEVSAALAAAYPAPTEGNWYGSGKYWVMETHDDYLIVCEQTEGESAYYRISYAEVDDKFTFGEPVEMEKVWVPAERSVTRATEMRSRMHDLAASHQAAADAHKSEAATQQGAADAIKAEADKQQARMEACSASMGNHDDAECNCQNRSTHPDDVWDSEYTDDSDEDNERKAARKAESRAAFTTTLEVRAEDGTVRTKTVDSKNLPASSFAFVGDKDKTETWKLPIHDADHTRNALARLNQTDGIPADKKAGVIRKIKAAAKKFGIDAASLDEAERTCPLDAEGLEDYKRRARLTMLGIKVGI